ncbi:MAG: hypothetical protein JNM38_22915 [Acidobacteria bacterium]|nr:hypothetical protein [Acidobacteriota bacterium]
MSTPADIVVYVSGHGFGHASRDIEVINAILDARPATRIQVRTYAARWLFDLTIRGTIDYRHVSCDTGVIQVDSLRPDLPATVRAAREFYATIDTRVAAEADALRATGARLVIADLPPLAFAAAHRAGIPSVALGNFTWDWIYDGYQRLLGDAAWIPGWMREAHALANEAWRMPMHGGFGGFAAIRDLPFVARHSRRDRAGVRDVLGLRPDATAVLVSFGGFGLDTDGFASLRDLGACDILMADSSVSSGAAPRHDRPLVVRDANLLTIDEHVLYGSGFRYEDLVLASDVVVTKPGYGIIAECLANDTAIVYTPRGEFAEYDVLVAALARHARAAFISNDDLRAGRWADAIAAAVTQARKAPVDTTGAGVAAGWALARV